MRPIDLAVVGAGPVGATLAALAAGAGLEIELFEARPGPSTEGRVLALSHGSREILEGAAAWHAERTTPIRTIHVSQKGGPGRTLLDAGEQGLPALGYTIAFRDLDAALSQRLAQSGVAVRYGESCEGIELDQEGATLRFASGREARARLLVLADGGANASRIPGIAYVDKDYGQHAVTGSLGADRPHGARAYERFTNDGPLALLPFEERYALVWTATPAQAARLAALDDALFLSELQDRFGDRAGRFVSISARAAFPLRLRTVNTPVALRTAIIGNAAQSLHPIAGQGLNLGLRDAAALAAALASTPRGELGASAMLNAYRQSRVRDATRGVAFTDFLVSAFAPRGRLPALGRGLALTALDLVPRARRALAERMIHGAGE